MSTKPSGQVHRTYEFIRAHRHQHSVQVMCRLLGVAASGYYPWLAQPVSDHGHEDARLLRLIRASFTASQGIYGARGCSSISARPAKPVASTASLD
jgi:putative transposase